MILKATPRQTHLGPVYDRKAGEFIVLDRPCLLRIVKTRRGRVTLVVEPLPRPVVLRDCRTV